MVMWNFLTENIANVLILLVLAVIVAIVVIKMVRDKNKGKDACGCSCDGCALSGQCSAKNQQNSNSER